MADMAESSDRMWLDRLLPRFRLGSIVPGAGGVQRGVDYQFYRLAPLDVMAINVGLGVRDYSAAGVEVAMAAFWTAAQTLVHEGAQAVILSGVPVSAALGRARILDLQREVAERFDLPLHATLESILDGLLALGTRRIVLASRFPAETNQAIAQYLAQAGVDVVGSTARELSLNQARQLTLAEGMQLALEVGREAGRAFPEAEAIVLPGGATLSLHAVPALEAEFDKPVLINLSAEIWRALVQPGIIPPVTGWGRLLSLAETPNVEAGYGSRAAR
jgi:maleate cis-trans isomerase